MRFACLGCALLVTLGFRTTASATCTLGRCDQAITRLDGSAFPEDDRQRPQIGAGEPFFFRLRCETSCGVAGGSGGSRGTLSPLDVGISRVDRIGRLCAAGAEYEPTSDPFIVRVRAGLPAGHYRVGYRDVVVGDPADAGECPAPPPPPPVEQSLSTPFIEPPPPPGRSWLEDWDDRRGATWEIGGGPWLGVWAAAGEDGARGTGYNPTPGAVAVFGVHGMVPSQGGDGDDLLPEIEGLRFCAFIGCGLVGMLFAPGETWVGNELGIELRAAVAGSTSRGDGALVRGSVRPFLRYSRGSLRTQTLVGMLSPEIGVQWHEGRGTALVLSWSVSRSIGASRARSPSPSIHFVDRYSCLRVAWVEASSARRSPCASRRDPA
jgi:hypothetical protein